MSWPYEAYCPKHGYVDTKPFPLGEEGLVFGCAICDSIMVYESKETFIEKEQDRLEKVRACDHTFRRLPADKYDQRTEDVWQCRRCGLPRDVDPIDYIHPQAKEAIIEHGH